MPGFLSEVIEHKRAEVAERRRTTSIDIASLTPGTGAFKTALRRGGRANIIAEIKPSSPSAGKLRDVTQDDLRDVLAQYQCYASAISVLTDKKYFGGSIELLAHVSSSVPVPTLCKDFVVDPYQVLEARAAGAQAVLLIVRALTDVQFTSLFELTVQLGMTAVVEVNSREDLDRTSKVPADVVLINNRCLDTFVIDLSVTEALAPLVSSGIAIVSASGINSASDIRRLSVHTNNFLIGSALMSSGNVDQKLMEFASALSTPTGASHA